MLRFDSDSDGGAVVVGGSGSPDAFPLGSRLLWKAIPLPRGCSGRGDRPA